MDSAMSGQGHVANSLTERPGAEVLDVFDIGVGQELADPGCVGLVDIEDTNQDFVVGEGITRLRPASAQYLGELISEVLQERDPTLTGQEVDAIRRNVVLDEVLGDALHRRSLPKLADRSLLRCGSHLDPWRGLLVDEDHPRKTLPRTRVRNHGVEPPRVVWDSWARGRLTDWSL